MVPTMDKSCSCPLYREYTANSISIPAVLPWFYPHSRENTAVIVPITAVITVVTMVLSLSPSPHHSLTVGDDDWSRLAMKLQNKDTAQTLDF